MKFTTGTKEIKDKLFFLKRTEDHELEKNYNVGIGKQVAFDKKQNKPVFLYHNVPAIEVKIGENVYTKEGEFYGYRSE